MILLALRMISARAIAFSTVILALSFMFIAHEPDTLGSPLQALFLGFFQPSFSYAGDDVGIRAQFTHCWVSASVPFLAV